MISHERAQELISARMDAPLTPAEHRELHAHLAACAKCRVFVMQADEVARNLQVMPRLAPSPVVSRAVMSAIAQDSAGWSWLRRGLQALSSPGLAVASALALVVALAGALFIALIDDFYRNLLPVEQTRRFADQREKAADARHADAYFNRLLQCFLRMLVS